MTYQLFNLPKAVLHSAGAIKPGWKVSFFLTTTTTPTDVYTTSALNVAHTQPVEADSGATLPAVYLDPTIAYKASVYDENSILQYTIDPVNDSLLSQASIGTALYPTLGTETGVLNNNYAYGNVLRFGTNTVPGTTDMTTAFQNAALSSMSPYAPAGTYLITGAIPLIANQSWELTGAIINITGTTLKVFTATAVNDWSITGGTCVGDNGAAGATSGNAAFISVSDCMRWRINKPSIKNIKGWGIVVAPGSSTSSRAEHGQIINPQIAACYYGIECQAGTGAEYVTISAPNITRCSTGLLATAGNTCVIGGSITDNTDGVYLTTGSNTAHGIFDGVEINHNTQYNIRAHQVTNGHTFSDCHIFQGDVWFDRCKGMHVDGGHFDPAAIYNYQDGSSGMNVIENCYFPGGYGPTRKVGSNDGHYQLIIRNCWGPGVYATAGGKDTTGLTMNDAAICYVQAQRDAAATQSLTSGVAATMTYSTVNYLFDRRLMQSAGTFTIPADQSGIYHVDVDALFGGTAMSATASFIEMKVGGTTKKIMLPSINSTTTLQVQSSFDFYFNGSDAVTFVATITGTTPIFGNATWPSNISLRRIA